MQSAARSRPVVFDMCIVGAGMIGSSAARHAVDIAPDGRKLTVCLIGPEEPQDRAVQSILGAHYDEARITRSTASDSVWAGLSNRSIARYRQLEQRTGVHFYDEVGCLTACERKSDFYNDKEGCPTDHVGAHTPRQLNSAEIHSLFPYLYTRQSVGADDANDGAFGIYESAEAGLVNPRKVCLAQQTAAVADGCHVIRDVVNDVSEVRDDNSKEAVEMKVVTDGGEIVMARSVLLAVGAFSEFRNLLPQGLPPLDLRSITQSVIFVELSAEDAVRLRKMPSMLLLSSSAKVDYNHCYVLPPVKYPDGKVYVKLGHGSQCERDLPTPEDITRWYRSAVPAEDQQVLNGIFHHTFPDVTPVSVHYDNCVTTNTPTRRPYIDLLSPRLAVALGGNGRAAKCCDEIGKLAVNLLATGQWTDTELSRDDFKVVFKQSEQVAKS